MACDPVKIEEEASVFQTKVRCDHNKQSTYTQRRFDILKGFEINETRCFNCHKIVVLDIKKFR